MQHLSSAFPAVHRTDCQNKAAWGHSNVGMGEADPRDSLDAEPSVRQKHMISVSSFCLTICVTN